ncbi:MAG: acetate--CoA ligase family protein, partial [Candidatus Acetothermia bacterium]
MAATGLEKLFHPKNVAVIGASEHLGSVGATLLKNASRGFHGRVFAVNPNRDSALGFPCYPSVGSVPEAVDVAVIATPASTVPGLVKQCGEAGVRSVIVVSAGFSEIGPGGAKLQEEVQAIKREYRMRILGPNCLGYIRPWQGLNLSFAREMPSPGDLAFLSQSGAMGSSLLEWAKEAHVGFSAFVSLGNTLDICFADLIDYFGQDPKTKSILLYLETIRDPEKFIRSARTIARRKPIICLKGGVHFQSQPMVSAHVGISPRREEVYEAVFRRVGITRVQNLEDLFACSETLTHQSLPEGPRLAVVTNANGPAILALDALINQGGSPATLSRETRRSLQKVLPDQAKPTNPLDILGDADSVRYRDCSRLVIQDDGVDGLLIVYCPQGEASAIDAAEAVVEVAEETGKPVLTAWIGGKEAREGRKILRRKDIVTCPSPEQAAKAFHYLFQYARNLEMLYQTPRDLDLACGEYSLPPDQARRVQKGVAVLPQEERRNLFDAYGIPSLKEKQVNVISEARKFASRAGFPIRLEGAGGWEQTVTCLDQLKLAFRNMFNCQHPPKSGVLLKEKLPDGACTVSLTSRRAGSFGAIIALTPSVSGSDSSQNLAVEFPPLNQTLALRLLEESGVDRLIRNSCEEQETAIRKLEELLVSFSQLVIDFPQIVEISELKLAISSQKIRVSDAEVKIGPIQPECDNRSHPHLIINPYPDQYVQECQLADSRSVIIRPIRPEDEPQEVELFKTFSEETW